MEGLRRLREERGWSQQKLADESGVNKATINQIERGRRSPNVETLEKLAQALQGEVADFFPKAQASLFWEPSSQAGPERGHEVAFGYAPAPLDNLDAKSLAKLNSELVDEIDRVRATTAEDIKQERIAEIRERLLEITYALNRKGLWHEPEISEQRRRPRAPQGPVTDSESAVG